MTRTHFPDENGLPQCGKPLVSLINRISRNPTCRDCVSIRKGIRRPANPTATLAKYPGAFKWPPRPAVEPNIRALVDAAPELSTNQIAKIRLLLHGA